MEGYNNIFERYHVYEPEEDIIVLPHCKLTDIKKKLKEETSEHATKKKRPNVEAPILVEEDNILEKNEEPTEEENIFERYHVYEPEEDIIILPPRNLLSMSNESLHKTTNKF